MTDTLTKPKPKPKKPKAKPKPPRYTSARVPRKQQQTRIKTLQAQGHSIREIAAMTGYTHPTISKYLKRLETIQAPLKVIQSRTADILFDNFTLSSANLSNLLMEVADRDVKGMSVTELNKTTETMSKVMSFAYEKHRLETGKSTSNNSHEIQLKQVHNELPFKTVSSGSVGSAPEA